MMMDKSGFAYLIVLQLFWRQERYLVAFLAGFFFVVGVFCVHSPFFSFEILTTVPDDPMAIVSPADGVIIAIDDMRCLHIDGGSRIVIFMSQQNVHVNRVPFAGEIEYLEHFPGKFLKAYLPETSIENETCGHAHKNCIWQNLCKTNRRYHRSTNSKKGKA
jgi:phosphatidylserine decarboxylase